MELLKYQSPSRVIFFEPKEVRPNGFIEAQRYFNSVFLESGTFDQYLCNEKVCVPTTQEEKDMYQQLKDRSVYLIGK